MLSLPSLAQVDGACPARIFLCVQPTDMRRGFDRLAQQVQQVLQQDPLSGHLFLFRSRSGDRLKLLVWEDDGFAIYYKRLEKGTFRFPRVPEGQASLQISASELAMLLEGIDLRSIQRRPRWHRPAS